MGSPMTNPKTSGEDLVNSMTMRKGIDRDQQPIWINTGLTKREYFAAMAMQGAMVGADIDSLCAEGAAEVAVKLADALILALNKETI